MSKQLMLSVGQTPCYSMLAKVTPPATPFEMKIDLLSLSRGLRYGLSFFLVSSSSFILSKWCRASWKTLSLLTTSRESGGTIFLLTLASLEFYLRLIISDQFTLSWQRLPRRPCTLAMKSRFSSLFRVLVSVYLFAPRLGNTFLFMKVFSGS